MHHIFKFSFVISILLLSFTIVLAKPAAKGLAWNEYEPLNISSKSMEFNPEDDKILFKTDVTIKQADFLLTADSMVVKKQEGDTFSLMASGNVAIVHGLWQAGSDVLEYNSKDKVFLFSGHPKVVHNKNIIKGKLIRYYSQTNKIEVEEPETTMYINDLKKNSLNK